MKQEEIFSTLETVFRTTFKQPDLSVRPEDTAGDIDGWDSLTHMQLIAAVEATFAVRFNFREIMKLKNVGDLAAAVARKVS